MTDAEIQALKARVERLEHEVARLAAARETPLPFRQTAPAAAPPAPAPPLRPSAATLSARPAPAPSLRPSAATLSASPLFSATVRARGPLDWLRLGEDWVGKVGGALLFLGLALLYRYAVDQGWITPVLRVCFGVAMGSTLTLLGLGLRGQRLRYSQLLLGLAIAVFYLTGWAAQVLYGLVPWSAGFIWMIGVTALAFVVADRRDHQELAVLGCAGGLATPFILDSPSAGVAGLVVYALLVLRWSGALQVRHDWRVLQVVNGTLGFIVMGMAVSQAAGWERWVAQGGVVAVWLGASVLPFRQASGRPAPMLWLPALLGSLTAVALTAWTWDLDQPGWGLAMLGCAAVLLALSRAAAGADASARGAYGPVAFLALLGTALAVGEPWYPAVVAAIAVVVLALGTRLRDYALLGLGHTTFLILALRYIEELAAGSGASGEGLTPLNLAFLGMLLMASFAGVAAVGSGAERTRYLGSAYAGFLAWLAWVLAPLPSGHALTSMSWAACALVLLAVGGMWRHPAVKLAGLATLAVLAGKLLLVDLSTLDAGVRILVFLGMGGVFVGLAYWLKGSDGVIPERER